MIDSDRSADSQSPDELSGSSSKSAAVLKSAIGGVVMGVQNALYRSSLADFQQSSSSCEVDERQEQLKQLYTAILDQLGKLPADALQPGQRRDALAFLHDLSLRHPDAFADAFERVFYTESRKLSDWTRASALRYVPDLAHHRERASYVRLLIARLASTSPSEASAAATALAEVADVFSVPALTSAKSQVLWRSAAADLDDTILELKGE